jgi:hypothetical protein
MRPGILIPTLVALALIWSGVAIVMSLTEDAVSSPEKVSQIVSEAPWRNGKKPSPAERSAYLDKLAKYYTLLDMEQRKTMREEDAASGEMMIFMMELTEEERKRYLSIIVEAQVQPLMKAWSLLSTDERRKMIGNARGSLRRNAGGATAMEQLTEADAKVFDSLIEGNLADYYKNGTDKQKLNLAPLLEELQNRIGRR